MRRQQQALGYEPLDPPIQRGWKRTFVLREDIKLSPHAEFFENLLKVINTVQYSHRRDFKKKKKRKGRKVHIDRIQQPEVLHEYLFKKLTAEQQQYFREELEIKAHRQHEKIRKYIFTQVWRFVLKVSPNMITEVKIIDPELESRQTQLDNYIERNRLRPRICKIRGETYHYRGSWRPAELEKYRYFLDRGSIREELEEHYENLASATEEVNIIKEIYEQ